jgi:hypothetical protein
MPAGFMAVMGGVMDVLATGLGAVGIKFQPTFTRSRVQYLTTHHYYSIEKVSWSCVCVIIAWASTDRTQTL